METQRQTLRGNMDLTSRRASPTWHANGYSTPRRTFPLLYWILFPLDSHPCTNPVTMASCPEKCGGSYSSIGLVIFIPVWWDNPTCMLWPLCRSWACFFLFLEGGVWIFCHNGSLSYRAEFLGLFFFSSFLQLRWWRQKGEMTPVMEATLETFNPCEKAGRQELLELSLIRVKLLLMVLWIVLYDLSHRIWRWQVACMPQNSLMFLPPKMWT